MSIYGIAAPWLPQDVLFREAAAHGFAWTVHRPHTIIGYAPGNATNMGQTLAVYAALCQGSGEPFIFPGSHEQWNALTDVTDTRMLAHQLAWAATTPVAQGRAYNISNGDLFRWRWLWPQIAAHFGVEWQGPPKSKTIPLEPRMNDAAQRWKALAAQHGLAEPDVNQLVSWWHTDGDLGRMVECVNDMTESRIRGFCAFQSTPASFFDLFNRLRAERLIPSQGAHPGIISPSTASLHHVKFVVHSPTALIKHPSILASLRQYLPPILWE